MTEHEIAAIRAAVLQRYGAKIEADDPAFMIVDMNLMALDRHLEGVLVRVADALRRASAELRESNVEFSKQIGLRTLEAILERQRTAQASISTQSRESTARIAELVTHSLAAIESRASALGSQIVKQQRALYLNAVGVGFAAALIGVLIGYSAANRSGAIAHWISAIL